MGQNYDSDRRLERIIQFGQQKFAVGEYHPGLLCKPYKTIYQWKAYKS